MSGRVVWVNGDLVSEHNASVSIYDSALMFGDMVFEMTRSFGGVQFKMREHLERLYAGLKILEIPMSLTIEQLEAAVYETIDANKPFFGPDDEHRVMINVSRGILGIYQSVDGLEAGTNIWIADFPMRWTVSGMGGLFDTGINAVIPSQRAIPSHLLDARIKNRSRLHYMMANIEASRMKGEKNWALMLDTDGCIAEGTGANVFLVKGKTLYTPPGTNILRGISRNFVIEELCPALSLDVREEPIMPFDLYAADEAFFTATPFCMLPITSLNNQAIGTGAVGPVFQTLINHWGNIVGLDIQAQIKDWAEPSKDGPTPYKFK